MAPRAGIAERFAEARGPHHGAAELMHTMHTVGISEMIVSRREEDILVTYALGSCLGLSLYDPVARVGGLIHCMLPLSKIDKAKAAAAPAMFVDTGVPGLLAALFEMGARRENLVATAAGAARVLQDVDHFKIGERNHTVLRKLLWKNSILIAYEDVGGAAARTMYLHMATGLTVIKTKGQAVQV